MDRHYTLWKELTLPGKIDAIRRFCKSGDTATEIVLKLETNGIFGQTRNAIIGFLQRGAMPDWSLSDYNRRGSKRGEPKPAKERAPNAFNIRRRLAKVDTALPDIKPVIPTDWAPARVHISDLVSWHCRMPLWPHDATKEHPEYNWYCGNRRQLGGSYCPNCHSRIYTSKRSAA